MGAGVVVGDDVATGAKVTACIGDSVGRTFVGVADAG
jgi:hypothetical protein